MRRDHLDDLALVRARQRLEELRGAEVLGLALSLRERLVGDVAHDVLEERVLTALGRAGVGLDREDLLADERAEERLEVRLVESGERRQAEPRERLPEHRSVLDEAPLLRRKPVETSGDESVQRLGHLELADRAGRAVGVSFADDEAAVEQHADRLDRVEGHAFGAGEDSRAHVFREARHESRQQLVHRLRRQRLEVDRREAALAASPGGALVGQLRTGEHEHEERVRAGPLEQVLEEVEQAAVGPLHVLEYEDRRRVLGEPLEEDAPGGEEVLLVSGRAFLEPEQVREPRLDPGALLRVRRCSSSVERSFSRAASGSSSSAMSQRMRTISARAKYATPSP